MKFTLEVGKTIKIMDTVLNYILGTYFWTNGARYQGEFRNDIIQGKGTLVLPETDGKSVKNYDGIWLDNGSLGFVTEKKLTVSHLTN